MTAFNEKYFTPAQVKLIKDVWGPINTDGGHGYYSQEASTINANLMEDGLRSVCPHCFGRYSKKNLHKVIEAGSKYEPEIGGWDFRCPHCKTQLLVWND